MPGTDNVFMLAITITACERPMLLDIKKSILSLYNLMEEHLF